MAAAARKKSQNKGLGRGLDALLGDSPSKRAAKEVAAEPAVIAGPKRELPIEYLRANADQPRRTFDDAAIEELASSIKTKGMLQPILVRPLGGDDYEIVAGERRWRAAQHANLHKVPVIIRELTDEETAEIAIVENVQRVDLNPADEAAAYCRLADVYGRSQEQIAKAVGKSRSHVANVMRLVKLPEKVLGALASGTISMGHARALLGSSAPDRAYAFVVERGLSVRQTEAYIREVQAKIAGESKAPGQKNTANSKASDGGSDQKPAKKTGPKDSDTRALERDLSGILGLDVAIEHSKKGAGSISIDYLTLDQLDDLCRRLMGSGI